MNNTFRIIGKMFCAVAITFLVSCTTDDGPSIDDYFLNYEIPVITTASDIPVGAFYYNPAWSGNDANEARYSRLIGERDVAASPWPQLCPHVRPVLGHYKIDLNTTETADLFQQHIDWANEGGIDFFILPNVSEDINQPNRLNTGGVKLVEFMAGRDPLSENKIKWGKLKYVLSVELNNFLNGVSNTQLIEDTDVDTEGVSQRVERVCTYFGNLSKRFFVDNKLYYEVDGKPMIVLYNAHKLYSKDSEALYKKIREAVREASGKDIYIVARQERWTPPARYHYFFMTGRVDAVYMDNMYDQNDMARSYMYPQYINENFKYNREYDLANYQVDFIPSIAPSFNKWLGNDGTKEYQYPLMDKNPETFRTMCNVAKMNLGQRPIVFIDSFNRWEYDMALEPTDPDYGNGYGMTYLNIVKAEFKK